MLMACGDDRDSRAETASEKALRLDDSSNEIVLRNNGDSELFTGSSYELEQRTEQGWVSADTTLERISGEPQSPKFFTDELIGLGPGSEKRYSIRYLDELPPGEYRVIVPTGDDKDLDTPQTLTFSR